MTVNNDPHDDALPLETLYDAGKGAALPLPAELARFYGELRFPLAPRPYIIANLVTSLDGVVSLGIPDKAGGKEISGSSSQDRALMGLLRVVADAVVVGAGTLREGNGLPLTGPSAYPPLSDAYDKLRGNLSKEAAPLAVVVTASGELDPNLPIFKDNGQVLIVTTQEGERRARSLGLHDRAQITAVQAAGSQEEGNISAHAIMDAIKAARDCAIVLVEGGPHLLGDFLAEALIAEQFLTLSPQIVGRDGTGKRLALVEGHTFAPDHPLWSTLSVVKRGESHLFLRYLFSEGE